MFVSDWKTAVGAIDRKQRELRQFAPVGEETEVVEAQLKKHKARETHETSIVGPRTVFICPDGCTVDYGHSSYGGDRMGVASKLSN